MAYQNSDVDWYDSQPTAAQRSRSDDSQTYLKSAYIVESGTHEEDVFEDLPYTNATLLRTQDMFHTYGKSDFISHIIKDVSGNEQGLESLRDLLFSEVKTLRDFPFLPSVELKKRRKGESWCNKLATDVYSLINVLDGGSFEDIKEMLSQTPRGGGKQDCNLSLYSSQKNSSKIDILSANVAQMQADLLKIKENSPFVELKKEVGAIKTQMSDYRKDVNNKLSELMALIVQNAETIEKMAGKCCSDTIKTKNDLKQLRTEHKSNTDTLESVLNNTSAQNETLSKQLDKRIGKLETRLRNVESDSKSRYSDREGDRQTGTSLPASHRRGSAPPHIPQSSHSGAAIHSAQSQGEDETDDDVIFVSHTRPIIQNTQHAAGQLLLSNSASGPSFSRANAENTRDVTLADVVKSYAPNPLGAKGDHRNVAVNPRDIPAERQRQTSNGTVPRREEPQVRDTRTSDRNTNGRNNEGRTTEPNVRDTRTGDPNTNGRNNDGRTTDNHDLEGFIQHVRKRTKRYFLGGFKSSITEDYMKFYLRSKDGPQFDSMAIIKPRRGGDAIVRLSVEAYNSYVLVEPGFWPEGIRCRVWYSKNRYQQGRDDDKHDRDYDYRSRRGDQESGRGYRRDPQYESSRGGAGDID